MVTSAKILSSHFHQKQSQYPARETSLHAIISSFLEPVSLLHILQHSAFRQQSPPIMDVFPELQSLPQYPDFLQGKHSAHPLLS